MSTFTGTGRWHLRVRIGDREVVAGYRDPITQAIERVHLARNAMPCPRPPRPSDVAEILAWHEANARQSAICAEGRCDHVVR